MNKINKWFFVLSLEMPMSRIIQLMKFAHLFLAFSMRYAIIIRRAVGIFIYENDSRKNSFLKPLPSVFVCCSVLKFNFIFVGEISLKFDYYTVFWRGSIIVKHPFNPMPSFMHAYEISNATI